MTQYMTMKEIETAMVALAENIPQRYNNHELIHIKADRLLVAALYENQVWGAANVEGIVKAYEAIDKWYSQE